MDICNGVNQSLNKELRKMRQSQNQIHNKKNDVNNTVNEKAEEPLEGPDKIKSDLEETQNQVNNDMFDIENTTGAFAGSCLDGVYGSMEDLLNNSAGYLKDLFPSGVELDIMGILSEFMELLNKLGIPNLIKKLDELLGCVSDADCMPVGEIDSIFDEINTFVDGAGLSPEGEFGISSFLDSISTPSDLKNALVDIGPDIENVKEETTKVMNATKSGISKGKRAPKDLY